MGIGPVGGTAPGEGMADETPALPAAGADLVDDGNADGPCQKQGGPDQFRQGTLSGGNQGGNRCEGLTIGAARLEGRLPGQYGDRPASLKEQRGGLGPGRRRGGLRLWRGNAGGESCGEDPRGGGCQGRGWLGGDRGGGRRHRGRGGDGRGRGWRWSGGDGRRRPGRRGCGGHRRRCCRWCERLESLGCSGLGRYGGEIGRAHV